MLKPRSCVGIYIMHVTGTHTRAIGLGNFQEVPTGPESYRELDRPIAGSWQRRIDCGQDNCDANIVVRIKSLQTAKNDRLLLIIGCAACSIAIALSLTAMVYVSIGFVALMVLAAMSWPYFFIAAIISNGVKIVSRSPEHTLAVEQIRKK